MKTILVRASILALAVTGFAASTVVSHSQKTQDQASLTSHKLVPTPLCWPTDPSCCGLH